jgi:hypothetical protein
MSAAIKFSEERLMKVLLAPVISEKGDLRRGKERADRVQGPA